MIRLPAHYYNKRCYWAHMITFRCNGGCPFCIVNGRGKAPIPEELPGKEIIKFWNGLEHEKIQTLSLIGGEPYLHSDILEIVGSLENYKMTITTNCASPIHDVPNFYNLLKAGEGSSLRVNTSYHPQLIPAERYIEVIKKYREAGHHVDQIAFVNYPGVEYKYRDEIVKVRKELGKLTRVPYLGFWNVKEGVNATAKSEDIEPNIRYVDQQAAKVLCGLHDMEAYRDICGASVKRQVVCYHPPLSLIISPDGYHYHCHYKLYYRIEPESNIKNFVPLSPEPMLCKHYGFCNWCDVPRVGCVKNKTAKEIL